MINRVFPSQFDVLTRTIVDAQKASGKNLIRILDLGAGPAQYYEKDVFGFFHFEVEINLLDAFDYSITPITSERVTIKRILGVVPEYLYSIPSDEYDVVVAFDLIEHLPKDQGYLLLYEIDRISSAASIVFTPNGFVWQPPTVDSRFDAHVSGWRPSELRKLGWNNVRGHGGSRLFRGPYGEPLTPLNSSISRVIDSIAGRLSHFAPIFAFAFSSVKKTKNPRV
jgi:hypothetical protein